MNESPAPDAPDTPDKKRLVFFGNERLSSGYKTVAPTLRALVAGGYQVCAVVTNFEPATSRKARDLEIAQVAAEFAIPLLAPSRPADIIGQLQGYQAEVGVLVAYGKIVPQSVIDIFPRGIINIHPSLLPLHRGSIPVESVILEGAGETGVSLMRLVKAMDAGPVYRQVRIALNGSETKQELTDTLLGAGKDALIECLPAILDGSLDAIAQDDSRATYDQLLGSQSGVLDFSKAAVQLEREVRAYAGWPKSRTRLAGKDIVVTGARTEPVTAEHAALQPGEVMALGRRSIAIRTSDQLFVIERLVPAGRSEMDAAAFLAGNKLCDI